MRIASPATRKRLKPRPDVDVEEWDGAYVRYDLVKELVVALALATALALALTVLFSSPDVKPSTIAQWARADPSDFLTTATAELGGTSDTATYGPPYNHASEGQRIGPIKLQKWLGVSHPVNAARDFVLNPLSTVPGNARLRAALAAYHAAPPRLQGEWIDAYTKALPKIRFAGGVPVLPAGRYGPIAPMMASLVGMAQSGGLDGSLLTSRQFFQTDYTKPLLLLNDGSLLADRAQAQHLLGDQWGMTNETGSYPGQVWLWLYTFWYQIKPFSTSDNADALVWAVMAVLSIAFVCIPFLPGVRSLPRRIPLYKLIWRDHYRSTGSSPSA
jgi:hypothetical protein